MMKRFSAVIQRLLYLSVGPLICAIFWSMAVAAIAHGGHVFPILMGDLSADNLRELTTAFLSSHFRFTIIFTLFVDVAIAYWLFKSDTKFFIFTRLGVAIVFGVSTLYFIALFAHYLYVGDTSIEKSVSNLHIAAVFSAFLLTLRLLTYLPSNILASERPQFESLNYNS